MNDTKKILLDGLTLLHGEAVELAKDPSADGIFARALEKDLAHIIHKRSRSSEVRNKTRALTRSMSASSVVASGSTPLLTHKTEHFVKGGQGSQNQKDVAKSDRQEVNPYKNQLELSDEAKMAKFKDPGSMMSYINMMKKKRGASTIDGSLSKEALLPYYVTELEIALTGKVPEESKLEDFKSQFKNLKEATKAVNDIRKGKGLKVAKFTSWKAIEEAHRVLMLTSEEEE